MNASMLVWLGAGVAVVFAVLIAAGLLITRRAQIRRSAHINAAAVLVRFGESPVSASDLLYGFWHTGMTEVSTSVRDQQDVEVAHISRRPWDTQINLQGQLFFMRAVPGWVQRAELLRQPAQLEAAASFEAHGWGGGRVARYVWKGDSALVIRGRWSLPWRRAPLDIEQNGRVIGQLAVIGTAAFDEGRAVLLPASIPLPVRIFVLWNAVGSRAR